MLALISLNHLAWFNTSSIFNLSGYLDPPPSSSIKRQYSGPCQLSAVFLQCGLILPLRSGVNRFAAAWVVSELLSRGYKVRGTVESRADEVREELSSINKEERILKVP